ncbi:MAG: hypothetical protein JSW64_12460 [Candidatus Zixiibacteriota bacterium]|nr:MAG: hypothetical protein JSW64_12460 [candidate division Zixibacteria bacterium]
MNPSAGKFSFIAILLSWMLTSSCIFIPARKPLNPRLLFTVGSEFLEDTESIAIRGSIDFEDRNHRESGSFSLVANRGDSLAFIIEGPFKVDIFRLVIIDETACARDRESDEWTVVGADEKLMIPDYGIGSITPDLLGYYIFPQFYLQSSLWFDPEQMTVSTEIYTFHILPSGNQKSFVFSSADQDLSALYGRRKDFGGGFYPSTIEISPIDKSWRIRLEIDKIKPNPKIPDNIWRRD